MNICILNSGYGSRMRKYTESLPKGLVPLCGSDTLLSRQISVLNKINNCSYMITTGYLDGKIQTYIKELFPDLDVNYTYNSRYATTNYITSLDLLKGEFDDSLLLLHGDLVFEESVAHDIINLQKSTVVVDSTMQLSEKDFKARVKNGKVVEIGIDVFGSDCFACQPMYYLTKNDWNLWQREIHEFCYRGVESVYAENALNLILDQLEILPLDVNGRLCMEVDNEDDLLTARKMLERCNG